MVNLTGKYAYPMNQRTYTVKNWAIEFKLPDDDSGLKDKFLDTSLGVPWDVGEADIRADIEAGKIAIRGTMDLEFDEFALERMRVWHEGSRQLWETVSIEKRNQILMDILFDDDNSYILKDY